MMTEVKPQCETGKGREEPQSTVSCSKSTKFFCFEGELSKGKALCFYNASLHGDVFANVFQLM